MTAASVEARSVHTVGCMLWVGSSVITARVHQTLLRIRLRAHANHRKEPKKPTVSPESISLRWKPSQQVDATTAPEHITTMMSTIRSIGEGFIFANAENPST